VRVTPIARASMQGQLRVLTLLVRAKSILRLVSEVEAVI
jgi:hypothetical protein